MKFNYEDILKSVIDYAVLDSAIISFSMRRRFVNFKRKRRISNVMLAVILGITLIIEIIFWFKLKWLSILFQLILLPFLLRFFDVEWVKELVKYIDNKDTTDNKMTIFYIMNTVFSTINDIELNTRANFLDDTTEIKNLRGQFMSLKISFSNSDGYYISNFLDEDYCKSHYLLPIPNSNTFFIDITYLIDEDEDAFVSRLIANELGNEWQSIKEYKENQQFERIARQQEAYEYKINNLVKSDKAKEIIKFIDNGGKDFGLSLWNLNKIGITETDNALVVRCLLNGDTTINQVKKNLATISKKVRVNVVAKELSDKGSINLVFQLNEDYIGKLLTVSSVVDNARKSVFDMGKGDLGEIILKLPHEDFPATLLGGLSRSGKSTLATMLITSILSMEESNNSKSYQDVFIGTVKTEDYSALKWDKWGMYIAGTPQGVYEMLQKVDSVCTTRKELFIKNSVVNIKQYNANHKESPLAKMLIVVDEYANLLSRAESEFTEIDGKKIKLSVEIERLCVKIAQEHISRGATLMIITQNFAKNALGKVYDAVGAKLVGYAPVNVASSLDSTQELANVMKSEEQTRKGLFFVNAPDLVPDDSILVNKMDNGFYKIRTNYLDTSDVKKNFNNTYLTASKYQNNSSLDDVGQGVKKITSLDDI